MDSICVKLRIREKNKYRKILSTEEKVFLPFEDIVDTTYSYTAGALAESNEWFQIEDASRTKYALDLFREEFAPVDFDSLTGDEFSKIDFLFVVRDEKLFFQNIMQSKLVSKKHILGFGGEYRFQRDCREIVVKEQPDAIYCRESDTLYFRRLESITSMFKGIDQLYREATEEETTRFLQSNFIQLEGDYSAKSVKTANRKRIALASKTIENLTPLEKNSIFDYIGDYCPALKTAANKFSIGNETEMKMLLYGIEQRFYTTPVGNERRIANSVILFD